MKYYAVVPHFAPLRVMKKKIFSIFPVYEELSVSDEDIIEYLKQANELDGFEHYGGVSLFEEKTAAMKAAIYYSSMTTVTTKQSTFYDEHVRGKIHRVSEDVERSPSIYLQFHPVVEVSLKENSELKGYISLIYGSESRAAYSTAYSSIEFIHSYTYLTGPFDNPQEVHVIKDAPGLMLSSDEPETQNCCVLS